MAVEEPWLGRATVHGEVLDHPDLLDSVSTVHPLGNGPDDIWERTTDCIVKDDPAIGNPMCGTKFAMSSREVVADVDPQESDRFVRVTVHGRARKPAEICDTTMWDQSDRIGF